MSEESPLPTSSSLNDTEEELLRLRLRIKELESQLYHAEMARDAYDYMIELAEQRYHIRVRKTPMPSSQVLVAESGREQYETLSRILPLRTIWPVPSGILQAQLPRRGT